MEERATSVTRKGQVTIPVAVRRAIGLQPRDKVVFEVEGNVVKMRRAPSKLLALYGSVTPRSKPEDFRKLREEFEQGVADEAAAEGRD